jgi:hypothetical protein
MPAVVLLVDLAWLQVPGADATTVRANRDLNAYLHAYPGVSAPFVHQISWLTAFNPVDLLLCTPGSWGCRFLSVTHRVIVARILDTTTFVTLRAGADADEKHRASFEAASLSGRTLRFADLSASELAADLSEADLQHANLSYAKLRGADLLAAQMQGASLLQAELQGSKLFEGNLQGADLIVADLRGADLFGARLEGADLLGARLQGTNLFGARLQGADLRMAHLEGADLRAAHLQGTDLRQAGLGNVRSEGTALGLADLRKANFDAVPTGDLLAKLPAATLSEVKKWLQQSAAEVDAHALPHDVDTTDGKILVTNQNDPTWRSLDRETQLTTEPAEVDPGLAKLLADTVAPLAPSVAEGVARRVALLSDNEKQRPLIKLLGCRLQAICAQSCRCR